MARLQGIPFIDRIKARHAIKRAKKAVKRVENTLKTARAEIAKARERADTTDRVSIANDANAVEKDLEQKICPVRSGGGGAGDECKEVKSDCRKEVGASLKGPLPKKFDGPWRACVTREGCDPND